MSSATHNIHVVVTQTGLDTVNSSMKSFATTSGMAQKSTDALGSSFQKTQSGAIRFSSGMGTLGQQTTKTTSSTVAYGKAVDTAGQKTTGIAAKFQGNKGAIFAFVGMASAGMEAVGMFGMYQSAADKVAQAQETVNKLEQAGAQDTSQYKNAVNELADAKRGFNFILRNVAMSFGDLVPFTLLAINAIVKMRETVAGSKTALDAATQSNIALGNSAKTAATTGLTPMFTSAGQLSGGMTTLGNSAKTAATTGLTPLMNSAGQLTGGMTTLGGGFRNTALETDKLSTSSGNLVTGVDNVGKSAKTTSGFIGSKGAGLVAGVSALDLAMGKSQSTGSKFSQVFTSIGSSIKSLPATFASVGSSVFSFFTNFGAHLGKIPGILKTVGAAAMAFSKTLLLAFLSNPITAAIALISAAVLGLATDFLGMRTAINNAGVALGEMIPQAKGMLQAFGDMANGALDYIAGAVGVEKQTKTMGDEVLAAAKKFEPLKQSFQSTLLLTKGFDAARQSLDNLTSGVGILSNTVVGINTWHTAFLNSMTTAQKTTPAVASALENLNKVVIASQKPGVDLAKAKADLNAALLQVQLAAQKEAVELTKGATVIDKNAASATKLQNATLGMSAGVASAVAQLEIMNATGKQSATIIDDQAKALIDWTQKMGVHIDTTNGVSESVKAWMEEMLPVVPALDEIGTQIKYVEVTGIDWGVTLQNIAKETQELSDLSNFVFDGMLKVVQKLGADGFPIVEAALKAIKAIHPEIGKQVDDLWNKQLKIYQEQGKYIDIVGEKEKTKTKESMTLQEQYNKKLQEEAEQLVFNAQQLGINVKQVQLSNDSLKVAVKFREDEKKSLEDSRAGLQELALQRGLDMSLLEKSNDFLRTYIQNNNLQASSQEEVANALTNLIATRQDDVKETQLQTQVQTQLLQTMNQVPPVLDMTASGLSDLVQIYDDTANATGIAADSVGTWYEELKKSDAVNDATRQKLIELAEKLKIDIPDAIKSGSLEAFKEFIVGAKGLGDSAEENEERAKAAFDKLSDDASSALEDLIKEDVINGKMNKVIKKIEEVDGSLQTIASRQTIIKIMADTVDAEDKFQSLNEILMTTMAEGELIAAGGGQGIIDAFTSSISEHLGSKAGPIISDINSIWAQVKATAPAGATGAELIGLFQEALAKSSSYLQATGQQLGTATTTGLQTGLNGLQTVAGKSVDEIAQNLSGKIPIFSETGESLSTATVDGFQSGSHLFATAGEKAMFELLQTYDPAGAEAYAKANEIATETESGYSSGSGGIMTAGQQAMYDLLAPYGKAAQDAYKASLNIADKTKEGVDTIPPKTTEALAPVEGIFSQAFLDASNTAGTQLQTLVTNVHTKMSSMSTSVKTYSESMKTNFVAFIDGIKTALPPLDSALLKTQGAFSTFSTSIATYASSMGTNISTFSTNAVTELTKLNDYVFNTLQLTFSNLSLNVATYMTSMISTISQMILTTSESFIAYNEAIFAVQSVFSNLSSNVLTYMTSITGNIAKMILDTSKGFQNYVTIITSVQQTFSNLSSNIKTYTTSMTGNINGFVSASETGFGKVASSAKAAQSQLSNMSTSVSTYMSSMTTKVNSFSSASVTAFGKVGSAAEAAMKKVQALQKSIDALKDKTITITVNLEGAGVKHLQHGGSALNLNGPTYAAAGAAWVQNTPRKIGNTHVAETFPEIITAIPLDPKEKNSPFHDLNIPMPSIQQSIPQIRSRGGGSSGGGGQPINVYGEIHITNTLGDGRIISDIVKPFMLKNYSGITSS